MKIKAIVLTSNSLRHKYLLKTINDNFELLGAVYEDKGEYYNKQKLESSLVKEHFNKLSRTEKFFFENEVEDLNFDGIDIRNISKNDINNEKIVEWARSLNPDIIFLFGTGILKDIWLDSFENKIINLHLGLSPFYRGSATLFWPFVNDELECIGATIHIAAKKVDSGNIISRVKPKIDIEDNYYSINYKTIKESIDQLPKIVYEFLACEIDTIPQNILNSKLYKKIDFNETVLRKVINKYGENIPEFEFKKINESKKCICYQ